MCYQSEPSPVTTAAVQIRVQGTSQRAQVFAQRLLEPFIIEVRCTHHENDATTPGEVEDDTTLLAQALLLYG